MSTVARQAQKPVYKDYVSFLENYKNGSGGGTSKSTTSEDVVDNSTTKFQSYNEYLDNLKNKKFNPVKPQFVDNNIQKNPTNRTMKSEIFIEIQEPDNRRIEKKINLNESVSNVPPTVIKKEPIGNPTIPSPPPPPPITLKKQDIGNILAPPPPPLPSTTQIQPPYKFSTLPRSGNLPPPTPSINSNKVPLTNQRSVDKNDPRIRKLVNGALRDLYGAYHGRANDIVATLPRNMVKKNNNIQNIINDIALKGDLDKLNGRINPKSEQE